MEVKRLERCYTGGGIYIYKGELEDGRWFVAGTLASPEFITEDPFAYDWDEPFSYEWLEKGIYTEINVFDDTDIDGDDLWEATPEDRRLEV